MKKDVPGCSDHKASAYNAGEQGLIPGLGRSPGERNGNPLQYSCLRIPWTENLMGYSPWSLKELDTTEQLTHTGLVRPSTKQNSTDISYLLIWGEGKVQENE